MRLDMFCHTCILSRRIENVSIELRDDGLYSFKCQYGHLTTVMLQEQPFELLYEIGANAILDSYYREAVSSFSASLERFYEFATHVLMRHSGKTARQCEIAWKPLSKHSERQLGAFIVSWANAFDQPPQLLPDGDGGRRFRNDVIHNGKIPSRPEAVAYGDLILKLVQTQVAELNRLNEAAVHEVVHTRLERIQELARGMGAGTSSIHTIISLSIRDEAHDRASLEDHLSLLLLKRAPSKVLI